MPTTIIDKNVEVILVIQEKEETTPESYEETKAKKRFEFSHLYKKLEWKGDALAE